MFCKLLESKKIVAGFLIVAAIPLVAPVFGVIEGRLSPVVTNFIAKNVEYREEEISIYEEYQEKEIDSRIYKQYASFITENDTNRDCRLLEVKWYNQDGLRKPFDVLFSDEPNWRVVDLKAVKDSKIVFYHKCHSGYKTVTVVKNIKVG